MASERRMRRRMKPVKPHKSSRIDPLEGPKPRTSPAHPKRIPFPNDPRSKARNRMRMALLFSTLCVILMARFFPVQLQAWLAETGVLGKVGLALFFLSPAILAYRSIRP